VTRLALALVLAAVAAAYAGGAPADDVPTDRAACEARGGKWGPVGMVPLPSCNLPAKDAGKICRDDGECEGDCLAELTDEQKRHLPVETTGRCSAWRRNPGCLPHVEHGWVQAVVCVD
jgi:hypothetical protein